MMEPLARFFHAECIKWRKSWVLVASLLSPLCQTGFLFVILWFSEDLVRRFQPGFEFWIELNYLAWNLIFMPITVAMVSELSWDVESEAKAWNLLLIQPVPARTHFRVKVLSHLALLVISQVILALLVLLGGLLLQRHLPPHLWGTFPPNVLLQFAGYSLLALPPLVAFHTWLSTRLPGLGLALTAALVGTWFCARLPVTAAWAQVLPWGMSTHILALFDRWNRQIPWRYFIGSTLVAVALTWLGTVDFSLKKGSKP